MALNDIEVKTMKELALVQAPDAQDNVILDRIKKLAADYLPEGWKNWEIAIWDRNLLFGDEFDPQVLNKLRFALPTVGMVQAFDPDISNLPERVYRNFKVRMLNWPFCVGLIIGPPGLAAKVRASAVKNELVMASLGPLKPLFVSRKEACRQLLDISSADDSPSTSPARSYKRRMSRLEKLEKSQIEMKQMFEDFLRNFNNNNRESDEEFSDGKENEFSDREDGNEEEDEAASELASIWKAPSLSQGFSQDDQDFNFSPKTREQDPDIRPPSKKLELQGIECQRLGSTSFNKVRYVDVQKKLQASPVFTALRINSELLHVAPSGMAKDYLSKMDTTLGCIVHGLLLQREGFSNAMKEVSLKYPNAAPDIKKALMSQESEFRELSDDVLQYACGRRAEIIDLRRKSIKIRNSHVATLLEKIPPSATHLYEEERMSELYRQHLSSFRPPFKARDQSFRNQASTSKENQIQATSRQGLYKSRLSSRAGISKRSWKSGDTIRRSGNKTLGYTERPKYKNTGNHRSKRQ